MTITSALTASRMGLDSIGVRAEVTSNNISNADRPGYVRRGVDLTSGTNGNGVRATGVTRQVDSVLQGRQRSETSAGSYHERMASGLSIYTAQLGAPGEPGTLPDRVAALQTELDLLTVDPGARNVQAGVLRRAQDLVAGLNSAHRALGDATARAEAAIGSEVASVNALTAEIAELNTYIASASAGSVERADLMDQRDMAIDKLSQHVDLRVISRGEGTVDVMTGNGASLIEGSRAHPLDYDRASGTLTAGGVDITPGRPGGRGLTSGALAAEITLLTDRLPQMGDQLDELARAMVTTFEDADASLGPGQAGLFTDAGSAFDPTAQEGLAGRIAVNTAVDPEQGGDLWRLRDGVGAAVPGDSADGTQVLDFVAALGARQGFDPARGLGDSMTVSEYAANLLSGQNAEVSAAERKGAAADTAARAIANQRSATEGVNVDTEIQTLLQIEQAFAANSQVIAALNRMMDDLLEAF
ncbi:flagellar hook-associated protein FlgK [Roseivivax sp. GX 12232]|uniref:flagellar hook-associated protein FlgK n=1 Tax=Roseivivax sp. GX 12232 TaxID=2900547 RepID=UPI001E2A4202|nr:flagellar hook-associated protein FlgK [Roseivivax sp. GX 12232]MCE0503889.1 flagellar hook-associated protein FlgK [Roseivivax sp. GX 12232]